MSGAQGATADGEPRVQRLTRADALILAGLTGLWIVAVLLVDPRGDFPILDDWSYGRSVKTLVEEGRLQYDGWNAPTLFLQVLYGALFCLPFGFSFEALRISTLVAGLAGGLGTYLLLREVAATRFVAAIGSLVLILNPSYFQHAFTFMTDVPFTALSVISTLYFLRALRTGTTSNVVLGTIFAAGATLIRQPGVMIPLGYALALLAPSTIDRRLLLRSLSPAIATFAVYAIYDRAIEHLQIKPVLLGTFLDLPLAQLKTQGMLATILDSIRRGEALFAHLSLLVLPFLLVLLGHGLGQHGLTPKLKRALMWISPAVLLLILWRFWPPDLQWQVFKMMLLVMPGQHPWGLSAEPSWFRPVLWSIEFLATAIMIFLLIVVFARIAGRREFKCGFDCAATLFGLSTSIMLLIPFLLAPFFERYLIPILPLVMLTLVPLAKATRGTDSSSWRIPTTATGILALVGFSVISVPYAHDHLLHNRARWQAVDYLIHEQRIEPSGIDGGLSVNGWYLFPSEAALRKRYINWHFERGDWWRNHAAEYTVAVSNAAHSRSMLAKDGRSPPEQLDAVWKRSIAGWLPGGNGDVLVCRGTPCRRFLGLGGSREAR